MHSSAAARPTSGCEPAPSPSVTCAPSWISRSALDVVRACASVLATTNSTPFRPAEIMLLTALPPPPPTPNAVMRGLSPVMSGFLRLMVMSSSFPPFLPLRRCGCRMGLSPLQLETLSQPLTHALEPSAGARPPDTQHVPAMAALEAGHLRVDQQPDRRREGRPLRRLRQARHAKRTADAHVASEDPPRRLGQAGELACATGQHDPLADQSTEAGMVELVAHHLERLLDARPDDAV